MKLYVVTDDDYEKSVYGVFDSLNRAEEFAKKKTESSKWWKGIIYELELNKEYELGFF